MNDTYMAICNIISKSREYIHMQYAINFLVPIILDFMLDSCLKQNMHIISYINK